ncbi:MAG: HAMP domain-containing sensor histidine kinase [Planctomycetota bacterium]|nr:HAMP domain-containing sensor histidine kinase [Planctomycetota bacterium]
MSRSSSLRPAVLLLLVGGLVFGLLGWRVLAQQEVERDRRRARNTGLIVSRAKAVADLLAVAPRGRPLASWQVEPAAPGGVVSPDEIVYWERLERAGGLERTPAVALEHYDALLHPELPTWVQDVAALRSAILLNGEKRFEESRRRLARAAEASPLLTDASGQRVRLAALRFLVLDGLARGDAGALRRLLDEAQDGARVAGGDVIGPARTLVQLAADLERIDWQRVAPADRRRVEAARDTARRGLRVLAAVPEAGVAVLDKRIAWHGGDRVALFGLDALVDPPVLGVEPGFELAWVAPTERVPAGALRLAAPLGTVAVVPARLRPESRNRAWLALALGLGLLAYVVGAGVALAGWRRSRAAAEPQAHFTAAVSHEMKTPLASVRAMAELLADSDDQDSERARRYGARIEREMVRLGTTVRNVLDAAHIERGTLVVHPEPTDPVAFLLRVARSLRPALEGRGFTLALDLEPAEEAVPIDVPALEGVLHNLIDNAAKFSGTQREITVEGRPRPRGGYRVRVLDRGVGLGSVNPEELFGRYNRGAAAREGAVPGVGLGLHIARQVVEAHGGRMRARSRPRGGAIFELDLPGEPVA